MPDLLRIGEKIPAAEKLPLPAVYRNRSPSRIFSAHGQRYGNGEFFIL
jgi:hypothetical protein